jgi:hypothetical protein
MAKQQQPKSEKEEPVSKEEAVQSDMMQTFEKEGFEKVNPDLFFYKCEDEKTGKTITLRGFLLDRRARPKKEGNQDGHYYVIGLSAATTLFDGDGNSIDAQVGHYAWVDERWFLQGLAAYMPTVGDDGKIKLLREVVIIPKAKRALGGGRSLWTGDVMARVVKPEHGMPLLAPVSKNPPTRQITAGDGDIPF